MASAASDILGHRVREIRQRRSMTARDLAARCGAIGAPRITHTVVMNLETGRRRDATVDELLVLAAALEVPPACLLTPLSGDSVLEITPELALDGFSAATWLSGDDLPTALRGSREGETAFRRARRPLNLLRGAWLAMQTLTVARQRGETESEGYRGVLTELARRLEEIDGLGIPAPPLPAWLASELADVARTEMEG